MLPALPQWVRIGIVISSLCFAAAAGVLAYRWLTSPVTLSVAVGSIDGEGPRLMNLIAGRLPLSSTRIRLKVVEKESTIAAAAAFSNNLVDLAVVRSDVGELSSARTVVLLTYGTALIAALPGASIKSVEDLKGKTVGIVGGDINRGMVDAIDKIYELRLGKTTFRDIPFADAAKVVQSKQVQALLLVLPITEKYLGMIRDLLPRTGKQSIQLLSIESAGTIATLRPAYESYELPRGVIRGAPPLPDDDMTTLRVPFYLVANKKIPDDQIADLAKAIMEAKRDLYREYPLLTQVSEPNTDKAAQIAMHPGATAFFGGEEKTFIDRYGDYLFYGMMAFGSLSSVLLGAWKFMGFSVAPVRQVPPLRDLIESVRRATKESDLDHVDEAIDEIIDRELEKCMRGREPAIEAPILGLVTHWLERLVSRRRRDLRADEAALSASSG